MMIDLIWHFKVHKVTSNKLKKKKNLNRKMQKMKAMDQCNNFSNTTD